MRIIFSSVFAALLAVAMPSLAHASLAEADIAVTAQSETAWLIAAELGVDLPSPPARTTTLVPTGEGEATVAPAANAFLIASPPDVPEAAAVFASEVQRQIAAALDASLFADPSEGETEMLVAQDLASMVTDTTGSIGTIFPESRVSGEADLLP
jgi:hypothetical protein